MDGLGESPGDLMATYSETQKARYDAVEREADSFGRMISVKRLRPAEIQTVRRIVSNSTEGFGPVMSDSMIAASVREIDGVVYPAPKSQVDLDIAFNSLDNEGMQAAGTAWVRLMGFDKKADESGAEAEDPAKNLATTPSLDKPSG